MTICTYKLYEESAIIRRVYGTSAVGMAIEKHCVNVWSNNVDLLGFLESIAAVWQGHLSLLLLVLWPVVPTSHWSRL